MCKRKKKKWLKRFFIEKREHEVFKTSFEPPNKFVLVISLYLNLNYDFNLIIISLYYS